MKEAFVVADTHGTNIEFISDVEDILIHCGDYEQGEINTLAKKILIIGNHDIGSFEAFDMVAEGLLRDHVWFTHEPAFQLPLGAYWNVCGHCHETDMNDLGYIRKPWHILLPPNVILNLDKVIWEKKNDPSKY